MIRTDVDGNKLWEKLFGGGAGNLLWSSGLWQTVPDGGYILSGTIDLYGEGTDIYLIKTDSEGNALWSETFDKGDRDWGRDVQQTNDNGFIIAGSTESYGSGLNDDFLLIKTDSNGNKEWDRTFGGPDSEWSNSVRQTIDGGYILSGTTYSYGAGLGDAYLIRTDSGGTKLWEKTFGGTGSDGAAWVRQTADGGFIITGYKERLDGLTGDLWLIKTDSAGNEEWQKTFGSAGWSIGASVEQATDGGYVVTGYGSDDFWRNIWIIKTDAEGNEEWKKTFGGVYNDFGDCVIQAADGGYVVVGTTYEEDWEGKLILIKVAPTNLYQVRLVAPFNQSVLTSSPTFDWVPSGGIDNAFAVDFAVPPWVPFWSTHENMHQVISETAWMIPLSMWNKIPSGKRVYWRVRGADLNRTPLTVVPSDEIWSFYKQ